jgi:membrane protein implicated in regulation of membrane protease activity
MAKIDSRVPPTGEEIHLPAPSLLPIVMAVGITLAVVGLTISLAMTAVGAIVFLWTLVRWVRETRRDIDELPLEPDAR